MRKAAATTIVGALLNQALLIISGSLSARILGPADRGHAALLALVPSVICIAGAVGLASAVTYFVAGAPSETRSLLASVRGDRAVQVVVLTAVHVLISFMWLMPRVDGHGELAVWITRSSSRRRSVARVRHGGASGTPALCCVLRGANSTTVPVQRGGAASLRVRLGTLVLV